MDYVTFAILVLIVGLLSAMTADIILDFEAIWKSQFEFERGSGRDKQPPTKLKVANISWVNVVENSQDEFEVDVIEIAKSRIKVKPVISAGVKVRQLLDSLGKSVQVLVDYSAMTIRELKLIAKERRLPKYGSMRKAELVAALSS